MTISSVNGSSGNDYPTRGKSNEIQSQGGPCEYIWGHSNKTKNLNAELNRILGNDGVSSYEEATALAEFCIGLKYGYNYGSNEYKKCDIEEVARMVDAARREYCNKENKPNVGL